MSFTIQKCREKDSHGSKAKRVFVVVVFVVVVVVN